MRRARRVVLALVATMVPLALAEIAVRTWFADGLSSPQPQREATLQMLERVDRGALRFRGRANARFTLAGIEYQHDALGLRTPPIAAEKPAGVVRLLCLGDSTTYGLGVAETDCWPRRLEAELNTRPPRGQRVEVVNAGVPAFNTADALALFEDIVDRVDPDAVLLGWFANDLERLGFHLLDDGTLFPDPLPVPDALRPILLHSAVYCKLALSTRLRMERDGSYVLGKGENLTVPGQSIAAFARTMRERKLPFAIIEIPTLEGGGAKPLELSIGDHPYREFSEWLEATAANNAVPRLRLLDAIVGEPPPLLWVSMQDHHPNAAACQRFGPAIAEFVRKHALLERD
ncbi:MAG: hypothetical protein IPH13_08115 [Planctomycetes bacterium]|nr:hypothetical protein [Planctomycetota bacterium]MCC7170186.1 hypothetical protein [Planctomycetota bacterium]